MGSKLYKYLYSNKLPAAPSQETEISHFKNYIYEKYGPHGAL
jgi:hypothetical protein